MHVFEQEFYEGQIINEHYRVTHHTPEKPLYQRIYDGFGAANTLPWGGVQVEDIRDGWQGWQRVWPDDHYDPTRYDNGYTYDRT